MESFLLKATTRDLSGKKVKRLRRKQLLPGVVYGHETKSLPISLDLNSFSSVFKRAGSTALVDLAIDETKPVKVLIHQPQLHYLTGQPIHADFYAVKMSEKIDTAIPIHFVGQSLAVDELEGNFIANKSEINIRCLPSDLVQSVDVDISMLKTFEDQIRVKDLKLPEVIEVLDDPEDVIALVSAPLSEEELEAELAEDKSAEEAAVEALGEEGEETEATASEGESKEAETPEQSQEEPKN